MSFPYTAAAIGTAFCVLPVIGPAVNDWVKARRQADEADTAEQEQWLDKVAGAAPTDEPLTDFQRSVDAGFIQLPDFAAERRMRQHGRDAFERSARRTTIRHINTRGEL
ncbi:hypothetical protein PV703_15630 [Streptomyces sp. ME01-24h]|nr:hypothetical protein [Streptomyces sp. ME01-24h]